MSNFKTEDVNRILIAANEQLDNAAVCVAQGTYNDARTHLRNAKVLTDCIDALLEIPDTQPKVTPPSSTVSSDLPQA